MNKQLLSIKSPRQAQRIAEALNKVKPGTGTYYIKGYQTRRITETAAVKALQEAI